MKVLNIFLAFSLAILIAGCSSMKVQTDYDPQVNFRSIKTYDWMEKPAEHPDNAREALTENTLWDKRIKKAVNIQLIALGLQVAKENPDVTLTYHTGLRDKIVVQSTGGFHGGRRGRFLGRTGYVDEYKEGTIIVDMLDAKTKEIIWRGIAITVVDEEMNAKKVEETLNKAVKKMFEKFRSETA